MASPLTPLHITVAAVNDKGVKDQHGEWHNVSRYADHDECVLPQKGESVTLYLDGSGFIRRVVGGTASPAPFARSFEPEPAPVSAPAPSTTATATVPVAVVDDRRQQLIVRQNALGHAVAILTANRGDGKIRLEDVLKCAEQIEAWTLR